MTMDRRVFLASTGVAAAATAGVTAPAAVGAQTTPFPAPHAASPGRLLRLAMPQSIETLETGTAARRLAHRLQTSLGDDTRIEVVSVAQSGADAVLADAADFYFGLESDHSHLHPAFALFAGLPTGEHLAPTSQSAWFAVSDGADLWDDLAGSFGLKAFAAGHTGASAGLFGERVIETAGDLKGMRIACRGLARDVAASLGMHVVEAPEAAFTGALSAIGVDAAEPLFATAAVAHWSYRPGFNAGGLLLSLGLRGDRFGAMARSEQTIIESVAAEARTHSLAIAAVRAAAMARAAEMRRWPIPTAMSHALTADVERAGGEAVDRIAAVDALSGRIAGSHRAFRRTLHSDAAASA